MHTKFKTACCKSRNGPKISLNRVPSARSNHLWLKFLIQWFLGSRGGLWQYNVLLPSFSSTKFRLPPGILHSDCKGVYTRNPKPKPENGHWPPLAHPRLSLLSHVGKKSQAPWAPFPLSAIQRLDPRSFVASPTVRRKIHRDKGGHVVINLHGGIAGHQLIPVGFPDFSGIQGTDF